MANELTTAPQQALDPKVVESVVLGGDLSKLTPEQRLSYYSRVCESLKLNPLTRPFEFIVLNGKLVMYAKRDATEQLRKVHGVSVTELTTSEREGVFIVTVKGKDATGREDVATGAVPIVNLKGEALANAVMKAETKAKRRLTLSICGLGMLDEAEVASITGAEPPPREDPAAIIDGKAAAKPQDAPKAEKAMLGPSEVNALRAALEAAKAPLDLVGVWNGQIKPVFSLLYPGDAKMLTERKDALKAAQLEASKAKVEKPADTVARLRKSVSDQRWNEMLTEVGGDVTQPGYGLGGDSIKRLIGMLELETAGKGPNGVKV